VAAAPHPQGHGRYDQQEGPELKAIEQKTPEPSGPNNVPGTTHQLHHVPQPAPKDKAGTCERNRCAVPNNRCSTLEQPPRHDRPR
jgi:hypothetical protein